MKKPSRTVHTSIYSTTHSHKIRFILIKSNTIKFNKYTENSCFLYKKYVQNTYVAMFVVDFKRALSQQFLDL